MGGVRGCLALAGYWMTAFDKLKEESPLYSRGNGVATMDYSVVLSSKSREMKMLLTSGTKKIRWCFGHSIYVCIHPSIIYSFISSCMHYWNRNTFFSLFFVWRGADGDEVVRNPLHNMGRFCFIGIDLIRKLGSTLPIFLLHAHV